MGDVTAAGAKRRTCAWVLVAALLAGPAAKCSADPGAKREHEPGNATVSIPVEGMSCGSCAASITRAVEGIDAVKRVDIDLAGARAVVEYTEGAVSPEHIVAAIAGLGYKTGAPTSDGAK